MKVNDNGQPETLHQLVVRMVLKYEARQAAKLVPSSSDSKVVDSKSANNPQHTHNTED